MARAPSLKNLKAQLRSDVQHVASTGADQIARTRQLAQASRANWPQVPHEQLHPDPDQPRKHFEDTELDRLADSILADGLQDPLRVYPAERGGFSILDGERRWLAIGRLITSGRIEHFDVPVLMEAPPERSTAGRVRIRVQQLVTSVHKSLFTPLEQANAILEIATGGEGDPIPAAQVAREHGFDLSMTERHLRVARGLSPTERGYIQVHYPKVALDPLDKLVAWFGGPGIALDVAQRQEVIALFVKKRPSAKLVDAVLAPFATRKAPGRPRATQFKAGRTRDGGFSVILTIPGDRTRDPAAIEAALRDLDMARQRLEELRPKQGQTKGTKNTEPQEEASGNLPDAL